MRWKWRRFNGVRLGSACVLVELGLFSGAFVRFRPAVEVLSLKYMSSASLACLFSPHHTNGFSKVLRITRLRLRPSLRAETL